MAWLVTLGSGSDASIWGIVVAGIIFTLVMIIWGTKIFGKKWESYKMEMESRVPCEYCCIKEDVFENMKFRCSDGHDEIWRMNLDEEAKVKDGETVMVILCDGNGDEIERYHIWIKYGKDKRKVCLITDVCII